MDQKNYIFIYKMLFMSWIYDLYTAQLGARSNVKTIQWQFLFEYYMSYDLLKKNVMK